MDTAINRQCAIIIGNEVLIGSQAAHWKLIVFSQKKSAIHTNFGIRKFQFSLIARFGLLNKQEKSTKTKKIPKWNGCSIDEFNTQIIMIENRISFQLSRPVESSAVLCCPLLSQGVPWCIQHSTICPLFLIPGNYLSNFMLSLVFCYPKHWICRKVYKKVRKGKQKLLEMDSSRHSSLRNCRRFGD